MLSRFDCFICFTVVHVFTRKDVSKVEIHNRFTKVHNGPQEEIIQVHNGSEGFIALRNGS